jgi:hypothetical protein
MITLGLRRSMGGAIFDSAGKLGPVSRSVLNAVLALVLVLVMSQANTQNVTSDGARALVVTQSVDTTGHSMIAAKSVMAADTAFGYATNRLATPIANAAAIASLDPRTYPPGLSQSQVLSVAKTHISGYLGRLVSNVTEYLSANGYSSGWYSYQQTLTVSGKTKYLIFALYIGAAGRPLYGDPELLDETPTLMFAVYTALAVRTGLPQTWAYPDAGSLKWQLRDLSMNPVSAWTTADTHGAYDQPQGHVTDPEWGLKCLVSKAADPACPVSYPDMRTLIDRYAATFGIVDYVRMVQPVYVVGPGGTRFAKAALDVYERSIHLPSCCCDNSPLIYTNKFHIGYLLERQVERALVNPGGTWSIINHFSSTAVSPTEDKTKSLATSRTEAANLNPEIIRPDTGILVDISTLQPWQIVNLAPITYH